MSQFKDRPWRRCWGIRLFPLLFILPSLFIPGDSVKLRGAGASFPAAVYKSWLPIYKSIRHEFVGLEMTYESIGSGGGKSRIKEGDEERNVEYAGSDSLLKESDYEKHPDLQMFPTMAGAVVIAFNIPGISQLNLSREHVVGIYNGSIQMWNDSSIQALNPGIKMPDARLVVIARADKSGTTEIFTSALSSFSSQWSDSYGTFSTGVDSDGNPVSWNPDVISYFGHTNRGVSGLIMSLSFSVGYLSAADAHEAAINTAELQNKAGTIVAASTINVQNAMDDFAQSFSSRFTASLSDGGGELSYPIAGYTYFVIRKETMENCNSALELYRYVEWFLFEKEPQTICSDLKMIPLSFGVANLIWTDILSQMTCKGQSVQSLAEKQKQAEERSRQTWRLPLFISIPLLIVVIIALIGSLLYQQYKLNIAIIRGEWKIPIENIHLPKKGTSSSMIKSSRLSILKSLRSVSRASDSPYSDHPMRWSTEECSIGTWTEHLISLRALGLYDFGEVKTRTKRRLLWMKDTVKHTNILLFFGITSKEGKIYSVSEFGTKGALHDVLQNDKFNLDNNFKFSLASDVVEGMKYLHSLGIIHGNLNSSNCLIDARWNVKIASWEFLSIGSTQKNRYLQHAPTSSGENIVTDENIIARKQFYIAPELINSPNEDPTKATDVFSFGILLTEIFTREDPYSCQTDKLTPVEVVCKIRAEGLRPTLGDDIPVTLQPLIRSAWSSYPANRPAFSILKKSLAKAKPSKKSVIDCMMEAVEEYVYHLEEKIEERTHELGIAMRNMESLLHKILPPSVATKLYRGEPVSPEAYSSVTIFFSDIVGFTSLSAASTPMQIVTMLNDLYTCFDNVMDNYDVYKVETIGDAYMVISGLPNRNGDRHAAEIATMAIVLMIECSKFKVNHRPGEKLRLRAGIHTGPVVAGVVGTKMPRYCQFGDTVNTASRMETTSQPMHIQITESTRNLLPSKENFHIAQRGHVDIKGKGTMSTFWLHGKGHLKGPSSQELVSHCPVPGQMTSVSVT